MQKRKGGREPKKERIAASLLAWYGSERRDLPWRAAPGATPDPYRVWLSEIMLQQTTVKAVLPRYASFLRQWPNVKALAAAQLGQVLAAWAGLGYYARARNLHACARAVVEQHGGKFPESAAELRKLPGIGDYTAAAVAAIAFGERATPVDGNIERVVALFMSRRLHEGGDTACRDLTPAKAQCCSSDDGLRHDLHAAPPGLRPLSVAARLPWLRRGHGASAPLP
jgi:A/G-specific adenine glycosylase